PSGTLWPPIRCKRSALFIPAASTLIRTSPERGWGTSWLTTWISAGSALDAPAVPGWGMKRIACIFEGSDMPFILARILKGRQYMADLLPRRPDYVPDHVNRYNKSSSGWLSERPKELDLKTRGRQPRPGGSNPPPSAKYLGREHRITHCSHPNCTVSP